MAEDEWRDKYLDERFASLKAALVAHEKLTATQFEASKEAITKAETAQADYNVRSNEFRGQLDDQAKTLMPRSESLSMFSNVDKRIDGIAAELLKLRDSGIQEAGKDSGIASSWGVLIGVCGVLTAIVTIAIMLAK